MRPKREMLDFQLMMIFYQQGEWVARHGWEQPINRESGYFFTQDDQQAHDWMVVVEEVGTNVADNISAGPDI